MKALKILTQGIVQGVGFRPYIYRLASDLNLKGFVRNLGNVVEIIIEGENTDEFLKRLIIELPPIARIDSVKVENIDFKNYKGFEIIESDDSYKGISVIPADIAICDKCLDEIRNPKNRRYKYPFNACTDCGPRFTVIENLPYDRVRTSMEEFPLCDKCSEEYRDVSDRRYHGEAICCSKCGPQIAFYRGCEKIKCDNPIKKGAQILKNGDILAIKGIGGTHLVVDAYSDDAIKTLRQRLNRPNQAFAVMSRDLESVENYASVSLNEKQTLLSNKRPIVILKKNKNYPFPESLSPDLHNIGVMLPYSPMHYLLFDESEIDTYVMTSANTPGEPMMIENEDIINGVNDYSLIHNRRILNRCDDSVVRFRNDELSFIRRSRGYTPEPYTINYEVNDLNVLALGPELDVTFSIAKNNQVYPSQHIGNTNKPKTLEFLKTAIENMEQITKIDEFDIIACDMHPNFFTTRLGNELAEFYDCEVLNVQHHHAHAVSLLNDHKVDEAIVIAADGVGYGSDNTSWGGEILYTDINSFERLGHLKQQSMPGGDSAALYPAKMLAGILKDEDLLKNYTKYFKYGEIEIKNILKQVEKGINVGITTSTGRVLDSVAVALEIAHIRSYEGECSMKLESVAYYSSNNLDIPVIIKDNCLDTTEILKEVVRLYQGGEKKADIAAAAQKAVAEGLSELAIKSADKKNLNTIGATGGVFYNEAISKTVKNYIEKNGYKFIQHINTCAGDGSVSLGQAIVGKKS